jgi:hypothetical protein
MKHNYCCQLVAESDIFGDASVHGFFRGIVVKKILILPTLALSFSLTAQAYTTGQFAGLYGIIRLNTKDPSGATNNDARGVFEAMDVPIQNSMMGPGKVIQSTERALQFICADRPQEGIECSIFIQRSQNSSVNPLKGTMQYKVTGPAAEFFTSKYHLDANGEYLFTSEEGNLKVQVKSQYFEVSFTKN